MKSPITTNTLDTGLIQKYLYAVKTHTVNFFLWKTEEGVVCFDSGFNPVAIRRACKQLSIDQTDVTHLFLTHSDIDHIGGISLFPNAQLYISADEEPMICGQIPRLFGIYHNHRIQRPYRLLHDGDTAYACGLHIRAVASPGHTPGSMCYVADDTVLFSGDAFKLDNGRAVPCPRYTMDSLRQADSIKRLARLSNIDLILTAHWGLSRDWNQAFPSLPE
jgi:glyoxylase-like metal-dependent hydrolase (beta-lactamase superfamily II)